jgi:hypothetical protein
MKSLGGLLACITALALGCESDVSLEGRPCPCVDGYACCELADICLRSGAACELAVTPSSIRMRVGAAHGFRSQLKYVTWSVEEPSGGRIDGNGVYRAPLRPGTYHVRATTSGGAAATATVHVGPTELTLAMGKPGAPGTIDGVGNGARFSLPHAVVGDGEFLYVTEGTNRGAAVCTYFPPDCEPTSNTPNVTSSCMLQHCPLLRQGLRRISLSTREVTRLAADRFFHHLVLAGDALVASTGYRVEGWPHWDPHWALSEIVRVDPDSGETSPMAGQSPGTPLDGAGPKARFGGIRGMAGDGGDTVYVIDSFEDTTKCAFSAALRKLDLASATVTTLLAQPDWPGGIPFDAPDKFWWSLTWATAIAVHDGAVFVGGDFAIWKYDLKTATLTEHQQFDFGGTEHKVGSLCFDGGAPIAVYGRCVGPLQTSNMCTPGLLAATDGDLGNAPSGGVFNAIWCDGSGTWYVTDSGAGRILRFRAGQPSVVETFAGESAHTGPDSIGLSMRLTAPTGLTSDAAGNIAFKEGNPGPGLRYARLVRLGPLGKFTSIESGALLSEYELFAGAQALGTKGTLYFTSRKVGPWLSGPPLLWQVDLETGANSLEPTAFDGSGPQGLVHDGVDTLYWPEKGGVVRFRPGVSTEPVVSAEDFHWPLAIDGTSRIFAARSPLTSGPDEGLAVIDLADGAVRNLPRPPDGWRATGLAYDPAGLLYIAEPIASASAASWSILGRSLT